MVSILTLVNTGGLDAAIEHEAPAFLRAQGVTLHELSRHGNALDLTLEGTPTGLEAEAEKWKVDFALQPAAHRQKRLLVSDMESTLVQNEFLDDIAALAGVGERVRDITARAMNGELDFAGALKARLALIAGQPEGLLEKAWEGVRWMPGAKELFAALRTNGVRTLIVSGGFRFFTGRVREILGADGDSANDLVIENGKFTGAPVEPILGREVKEQLLERTATEMGIPLHETLAVGDGANDLPMLLRAGLGVAFHAKPNVAAAAKCRVRYSDLTALLAFAGIR
ncbi:MAG TPA: phosphoserine phosphatase SerB [Chthoniobacteraceae bacterium]|nr:phosphoserine phosphatase SerB [Chthoniobacteraceae bacterium]